VNHSQETTQSMDSELGLILSYLDAPGSKWERNANKWNDSNSQ
jgi:hypothetical protein